MNFSAGAVSPRIVETKCGLIGPMVILDLYADEAHATTFMAATRESVWLMQELDTDPEVDKARENYAINRVQHASIQWLKYHDKYCDCMKEDED